MAALAGYFYRKYRTTGSKGYLKSMGAVALVVVFFLAFGRAVEAVIYPEKTWLAYTVALVGALGGTLLMGAGYEGGRQLYALAQGAIFAVVTSLMISCLPSFRTVIIVGRAQGICSQAVPGSGLEEITSSSAEQKLELAGRLAQALESEDHFVRLGALYKLAYMPAAAVAALPAVIKMTENTRDNDELEAAAGLIAAMGPPAAAAAPALQARLAGAEGHTSYKIEAALKVLAPAK
jgi:hypothetical protein